MTTMATKTPIQKGGVGITEHIEGLKEFGELVDFHWNINRHPMDIMKCTYNWWFRYIHPETNEEKLVKYPREDAFIQMYGSHFRAFVLIRQSCFEPDIRGLKRGEEPEIQCGDSFWVSVMLKPVSATPGIELNFVDTELSVIMRKLAIIAYGAYLDSLKPFGDPVKLKTLINSVFPRWQEIERISIDGVANLYRRVAAKIGVPEVEELIGKAK